MTVQIQLRRGTAAQWTAANPTMAAGEMGLETDTGKIKMGDGTTAWNSLGYFGGAPSGAAGGDLSGTYPNPNVQDNSHAHDNTSVTTHSTAHTHASTTGQTANDHHNQSHDHSAAGDGQTLTPATLNLPTAAAPAQTADGQVKWDSDDNVLTVGDGAATLDIGPLDSTAPVTQAFGDAAANGAARKSARRDHKHGMPAEPIAALLTTRGDIITRDASVPVRLAIGAANTILGTDGTDPIWRTVAAMLGSLVTTRGDLITRDATTVIRKALGATGAYLGSDGTDILWRSKTDMPVESLLFPASQVASSNVNSLDDYEEGTFTPTIAYATPGTSSWTAGTKLGWYTKIGNVVFYTWFITSVPTNGTASGNVIISGLPFTNAADSNRNPTNAVSITGYTKANYTAGVFVVETNASTGFIRLSGSAQANAILAVGDVPTGGTVTLRSSGFYQL